MNDWFFPRGSLADGDWEAVVDGSIAGWAHTGLRVAELDGSLTLEAGPVERMVVPLAGSFTVRSGGSEWRLEGRSSVFDGPTDVLYLGIHSAAAIEGSGRVAVAEARADRALPAARMAASDVAVEIRGAGPSSRQVHNFGVPGGLDAQRLIVCEVLTPAGNWSSYPAHKHDEATGTESRLEEIYWFAAEPERGSAVRDPFGVFVAAGSGTTAVVRTGDVALVPSGLHGPAAAAPGCDLYYLNVMAGPDDERAWRITDDPAQAGVRSAWAGQSPDTRLPFRAEASA